MEFPKAAKSRLDDMSVANETLGDILECVSTTHLEGVENFEAAERFKLLAKIGDHTLVWHGNKFREHFLGIVESNVPARDMRAWQLLKGANDSTIISALGGDNVESNLAHAYRIMELGEKGPGHFNGWANITYKRSPIDHQLWAVRWHVLDGGIYIGCRPSSHPGEGNDGPRVFV